MPIDVRDLVRLHAGSFGLLAPRIGDADTMNAITDDHNPAFEPYASMGRERLAELIDRAYRAKDANKWQMLAEHYRDKMCREELQADALAAQIHNLIIRDLGRLSSPENAFALIRKICELAAEAVEGPGVTSPA
jgi:hypothetical protein